MSRDLKKRFDIIVFFPPSVGMDISEVCTALGADCGESGAFDTIVSECL